MIRFANWRLPSALAGLASLCCLPAAAQSPWPQDTKNPSLVIEAIPFPANYMNMGAAFLSDGRMVVTNAAEETTNGEIPGTNANSLVTIVSGISGDMSALASKKIADMFHQPSGVTVVEDKVYVAERDGFYRINTLDNPANTGANKTKVIGWPTPEAGFQWVNGEQWHQWVMTPMYYGGKFYGPYGGTTQPGGRAGASATTSFSGAFLSWAPDGAGGLTKVAGGLRQPNGMTLGANGQMFVTDNQGGWLPACSFQLIKPGKTYGYKQMSGFKANWAETLPYEPPIAWLVDGVHQSASQPMYLDRGPYAGDFIIGDVNAPGLSRVNMDKIAEGTYNGGLFFFTGGFATGAVNRLTLNPKEDWFVAGTFLAQGDWPSGAAKPMYRVKFSAANLPFEMREIHSRQGGVEIVFSQPLDPASAVPASFSLQQWHYNRTVEYGCCIDQKGNPFTPASVKLSDDKKRLFIGSSDLTAASERELKITAAGIKSAGGGALFQTTAYFTHNYQSTTAFDAAVAVRPAAAALPDLSGALRVSAAAGLRVHVSVDGAYRLSLLALDGKLLSAQSGRAPRDFAFPASAHGLRLLRIESSGAVFTRPVPD